MLGTVRVSLGGGTVSIGAASLWIGGSFQTVTSIAPVIQPFQPASVDAAVERLKAEAALHNQVVLVDVGANSGSFTLPAAFIPQMHVFAFEPNRGAFAELERNVALNGLQTRVTTFNVAVGRHFFYRRSVIVSVHAVLC